MKNLYIIGGTMGVGKTSVCQQLKLLLGNCVYLDGDWCWDADRPAQTKETKELVLANIVYLLNSYINSITYSNIVFGWPLHKQEVIDELLFKIDTDKCVIKYASLICSEDTLRKHIQKDIKDGTRFEHDVQLSLEKLSLYNSLDTVKIYVDNKTPKQVAQEIINLKAEV